MIFSSPDPPPDVEFFNPLYVQRNTHDLKDETDSINTPVIGRNSGITCTRDDIYNESLEQSNTLNNSTTSSRQILVTGHDLHSVTC